MSCPSRQVGIVGHPEKVWIPAKAPAWRNAKGAHAGMTGEDFWRSVRSRDSFEMTIHVLSHLYTGIHN